MHRLKRSIRRHREALAPHRFDSIKITLDVLSQRPISLILPLLLFVLFAVMLIGALFQSDPSLAVGQVYGLCVGLLLIAIIVVPIILFLVDTRVTRSLAEREKSGCTRFC